VSPLGEETSAEADGAAADADADASPRQSVHSDATQPPPPPPRWGSARPRKARRDTDAEVNKERQEVKPVVAPVRSLRRAHLQPHQQTQGCARRTWTDGHTRLHRTDFAVSSPKALRRASAHSVSHRRLVGFADAVRCGACARWSKTDDGMVYAVGTMHCIAC
jgi:hypothetical protein